MIETGSFIGMAAMTRSELTIRKVAIGQLGIIPASFRRLGIEVEQRGDDLFIPARDHYGNPSSKSLRAFFKRSKASKN